ncbi:MAG: TetR/AcrR family transcriptional regulator [Candidatus Eremiobacteraeota bacterium]|nr:TetR/AcrR family transcriptional regulator [Candidatus Eremiobacteraeota bacterium]
MSRDLESKEPGVKEKIIKSARLLFSEKGYHGTSVQDIAGSAGVNKSMLFYYFTTKQNLYLSILTDMFESTGLRIRKEIESAEGCLERLRKAVGAYAYSFVEGRHTARMFLYSYLGLGPEFPVPLEEAFEQQRQPLVSVLEEGVKKGIFKKMDCKFMAQAIVGMLNILFKMPCQMQNELSDDEILKYVLDLIENGILGGRVTDEEVI